MIIYVVLGLLLPFLYLVGGRRAVASSDYLINENKHRKVLPGIIFYSAILLIVVAFRAISVGRDTKSYLWTYERLQMNVFQFENLLEFTGEHGYTLLEFVTQKIGVGFRGVIIFAAVVYLIPVSRFIYKHSRNPYVSFFLFLTFDYFCFGMTGMRQSIAMGLCLSGLEYAEKRKFIPFVLLVLLAVMFHSTAIVFLPVYFISQMRLRKRTILYSTLIAFVVFLFRNTIANYIRQFARVYYADMTTGGTGMYLFMVFAVLLSLITSESKWNETLGQSTIDQMMIIAVIAFPVLQFNPTVFRLHYYFSIALIVYIPNVIRRIDNRPIRLIILSVILMVACYYFVNYPLQNMDVVPYMMQFD